jgi:2-phosphosulfolactate phosphatase
MKIEVSLSPALYPFRTITTNHVTVAIDVLRATSAVCAAFQAGCDTVVPLDTLEGIGRYRTHGYLIAAERGGKKVDGAEYGNSPTEYLKHDMHGVKLAYSTTNGTISILRGADADLTLVGAFANLTALCDCLKRENRDTVLLCSGWQNDFCIEDTLVAGAIVERLQGVGEICGDAANMSLALWQVAKDDPYGYCQRCTHVHRLDGFGAHADVEFAFRQDTCPVVPVLKNGELKVEN